MLSRTLIPCNELRQLYEVEHLTTTELAHYYGCSAATISNRLRDCGINARSSRFQSCYVPIGALRYMYEVERLPIKEIAHRLGVSQSTISNRRRTFGIAVRPRVIK